MFFFGGEVLGLFYLHGVFGGEVFLMRIFFWWGGAGFMACTICVIVTFQWSHQFSKGGIG